jgi:hypothetical protein
VRFRRCCQNGDFASDIRFARLIRLDGASKARATDSATEWLSGERYSARRSGRTAHVQGVLVMSLTRIEIDDQAVETGKRPSGHATKTAAAAEESASDSTAAPLVRPWWKRNVGAAP